MTTLIAVELGLLIAAIAGLAWACWQGAKRLTGAVYERQKAMDLYIKAVGREDLKAAKAADQATERADRVLADARQTLEQVERHVRG